MLKNLEKKKIFKWMNMLIDQKKLLNTNSDLMKKIDRNKQHVQEEDNLRQRLDPKYFLLMKINLL